MEKGHYTHEVKVAESACYDTEDTHTHLALSESVIYTYTNRFKPKIQALITKTASSLGRSRLSHHGDNWASSLYDRREAENHEVYTKEYEVTRVVGHMIEDGRPHQVV